MYAFGIVLMEILTGQHQMNILQGVRLSPHRAVWSFTFHMQKGDLQILVEDSSQI